MNTVSQVLHVARKDLRQQRWLIIGFAGFVLCLSAMLVWRWPAYVTSMIPGSLALALLTLILVAVLIQSDSPVRVDAHWASLPLDPMAVLGAKLLVAGATALVLVLAGEMVVLLAHGVSSTELSLLLWESFLTQLALVGMAGVFASLTRDLRTYFVMLLSLLVTLFLVGSAMEVLGLTAIVQAVPSIPYQNRLLMVIGAAVVLIVQYRSRNTARAARLAGAFAALIFLLPMVQSAPAIASDGEGLPNDLRPEIGLSSDLPESYGQEQYVPIELSRAAAGRSYTLVPTEIKIHWSDGTEERVSSQVSHITLNDTAPGLRNALGLAVEPGREGAWPSGIPVLLNARQRAAIESGDASLSIDGTLVVQEARVVASLPLESGARVSEDGLRAQLERVGVDDGLEIKLVTFSIVSARGRTASPMDQRSTGPGAAEFVLMNREAGEMVEMQLTNRRSATGGLLVQGSRAIASTIVLHPGSGRGRAADLARLPGTELLLVDWVEVGRDRITIRPQGMNLTR